jgi:hypothetical protein
VCAGSLVKARVWNFSAFGPLTFRDGRKLPTNRPLAFTTALPYHLQMRTVAETAIFKRYADEIWSEEERLEFITWIALNPSAGALIPGSGGCRKVRWSRAGQGKRGGVRVIYFNPTETKLWLLIVYTKAKFDNLPAAFFAQLRQEIENAK